CDRHECGTSDRLATREVLGGAPAEAGTLCPTCASSLVTPGGALLRRLNQQSLLWPGLWRPPCSSASPFGSGPATRSGALAQALATRVRPLGSLGRAVPVSTAFPCTRTPLSPRTDGISWNSSSAIPPVVRCRWSGSRKTPTAISSTPSPIRGPTG